MDVERLKHGGNLTDDITAFDMAAGIEPASILPALCFRKCHNLKTRRAVF